MSKEVIIRVRDDLDGSDADETIEFAVRGIAYEIDLSLANVELFDKSLKQFIEVARRVTPTPQQSGGHGSRGGKRKRMPSDTHRPARELVEMRRTIRRWARSNGMQVNDRGVLATAIIDTYRAANPDVTLPPGIYPSMARASLVGVRAQDVASMGEQGELNIASIMNRQLGRNRSKETSYREKRDEIRRWANANGIQVAMTGFIKHEALDAYYKAHPDEEPF